MSCKRVSLSIGEHGGDSLAGTSSEKNSNIWDPFFDPEDIKILKILDMVGIVMVWLY